MYCENCGKKNEDDARFCEECGALLAGVDQKSQGTYPLYGQPGREENPASYGEETEYVPHSPYEEKSYREPARRPYKPHEKESRTGIYAAAAVTAVLVIALIAGVVMLVKGNQEIDEADSDENVVSENTVTDTQEEAIPTVSPAVTEMPAVSPDATEMPTATPVPTAVPTEVPAAEPSVEYVSVKYGLSAPVTDFQFPYSSERLLTQAELDSMESDSVDVMHSKSQLAINEILARYGYSFDPDKSDTSRDIYERVAGKDWYIQAQAQCGYSSANALIADMNSVEKQNIDLVNQWQQAHGCYY